MVDISIFDDYFGVSSAHIFQPREGMFHPVDIVAIWEVIASMSSSGFLAIRSSEHSLSRIRDEIFEFDGFDEICVPYLSTI